MLAADYEGSGEGGCVLERVSDCGYAVPVLEFWAVDHAREEREGELHKHKHTLRKHADQNEPFKQADQTNNCPSLAPNYKFWAVGVCHRCVPFFRSHRVCRQVIFQALIDVAPDYAAKYSVPVSKINDQEMASDFYMKGLHDIKLDHTNRVFQAMHATHAAPLKECDPWPEMANVDGRWVNNAFDTKPKILHFNGGGKIHHLKMEAAMWYKKQGEGKSKSELASTKLLVGDGGGHNARFDELCPGYF